MNLDESNTLNGEYRKVKPEANELLDSVNKCLHDLLIDYFWSNEEMPIVGPGRIKDFFSFKDKITKKKLPLDDFNRMTNEIKDLIGTRVIVNFKSHIKRMASLIEDSRNPWYVDKKEAFTDSLDEKEFYESIGFKVNTKETGYCGAHFDLIVGTKSQLSRVEVQVRTKLQDAWQSVDHPLYKVTNHLPAQFKALRKSIAGQFESAEKAQEFIFSYIQEKVTEENNTYLSYFFEDLTVNFGLPKDYIGKVIRGTLDTFYLVDKEFVRWTMVIDNNAIPHPVFITEKYLLGKAPELIKNVLTVPDGFLGRIPLAGSIEDPYLKLFK